MIDNEIESTAKESDFADTGVQRFYGAAVQKNPQMMQLADDEWEINNNSKSSDDFEDLFDLKRSTLMKSMKVEDVLEIISKIKGLDYTSNYPYLDDRRGLIMDLDDCFVKYCTIHGIPIEYGLD